jgi:pimeloyl-ACP methyl ester carboxylesterase
MNAESLAVVLVPGLAASPRFYAPQLGDLWRFGPVTIAEHTRDDSMAAIARRILATAPPRVALAGHSMGGYVALEIMRQAPTRVGKLALLDTSARADTPEQTERRRGLIALAEGGRFAEVTGLLFPILVHPSKRSDRELLERAREMAEDTGAEAFVRQQKAIISRPDSRPSLGAIRCPTLVLVGDSDQVTPPERAEEIAAAIQGARLVVVPECGHVSALEQPAAVSHALTQWLAG